MENITNNKSLKYGVRLTQIAVVLAVIAALFAVMAVLSLFTPLSIFGVVVALAALGWLARAGLFCSFVGKLLCLSTPVGRNLVIGSVAIDFILGASVWTNHATAGTALGFLSFGLFMGFFLLLADYLNATDVCDSARSAIKNYGIGFAIGFLGYLTGFAILGFIAAIFFLISFFSYLSVLGGTARAL